MDNAVPVFQFPKSYNSPRYTEKDFVTLRNSTGGIQIYTCKKLAVL